MARLIKTLRGCFDQSMRFRFRNFNRGAGAGNFEQLRQLSKRRPQRVPQSVDRVLGPDVGKDDSGDDETEKNSDGAIADVIEICVWRKTLEDTVEESEGYL